MVPPPGTYLSLIYTVNYSIICLFSYVEFDRFFILSFLRHEFRLEFRLDFRLECHSLDSCYPRSKIQDFQKAFLGNLGINPRSKIQDFQKTFLGCTCRILDAPKIQDPRFPEFFSWMQAGNLGCTQDPRSKISRKLFLEILEILG